METIRPWLHIGKYRDTLNRSLLNGYQIGAMLQLAEHVQHPQIATLYLPVEDGVPLASELLQRGITFVQAAYQHQHKVQIACGAGISRSATFATAVLKEIEELSLLEAITIVKYHHPDAMPHPALWESLCTYYGEAVPYLTLVRLGFAPNA
jgi:hypothetical protein